MKNLLIIALFALAVSCKKDDSPTTEKTTPQYAPDNTMILDGTTYQLQDIHADMERSGGFVVSARALFYFADSNSYWGTMGVYFPLQTSVPEIKKYTFSDSLVRLFVNWPELRDGRIFVNFNSGLNKGTLSIVTENGIRKYKGLNLMVKRTISSNPLKQEDVLFSFTIATP